MQRKKYYVLEERLVTSDPVNTELCDWLACRQVKMAAPQVLLLLLLLGLGLDPAPGPGLSSGLEPDSERGRVELRRVRSLAAQPRYGGCWARALEHLDTRCRDMTSESQSRIALGFTVCHLSR